MRHVSASKVDLAKHCVHPWVSDLAWSDEPGWAARTGTAVHSACELQLVKGHVDEMDWADIVLANRLSQKQLAKAKVMHAFYSAWLIEQDTANWHAEQKWAYDPVTGTSRTLPKSSHRDYSQAKPGEIVGTSDVHGNHGVDDIKTGWAPKLPSESDQMATLGLMHARHTGDPSDTVRIIKIDDRGVYVMSHQLDAQALDQTAEMLYDIHTKIRLEAEPSPGLHCKYCPVRASCASAQKEFPTNE